MSGGTVALATGVYEVLLGSLARLARAARSAIVDGIRGRGLRGARAEAAEVPWRNVLPLALGMLVGVIASALVLAPVLESHAGRARAVFFGLVLGAVAAPLRLVIGQARWRHVVLGAAGAVAAFVLTGIPPAQDVEPPLPLVALAVSVAVCALILPGVSAAFLLLTVGLYSPTLSAVNEVDVPYIVAAAAGGVLGLAVWAVLLQRLLRRFRTATLSVLAGLMLGSLRALWPWQGPDREILAPDGDVTVRAVVAVGGFALMLGVVALQARQEQAREGDDR